MMKLMLVFSAMIDNAKETVEPMFGVFEASFPEIAQQLKDDRQSAESS